MGEPVPEWQTSLDFNATRDNGGGGGANYIVSQKKSRPLLFFNNFGKCGPIFIIFFTINFRKNLWRKTELKLPPPLKSVAVLPCEM